MTTINKLVVNYHVIVRDTETRMKHVMHTNTVDSFIELIFFFYIRLHCSRGKIKRNFFVPYLFIVFSQWKNNINFSEIRYKYIFNTALKKK